MSDYRTAGEIFKEASVHYVKLGERMAELMRLLKGGKEDENNRKIKED